MLHAAHSLLTAINLSQVTHPANDNQVPHNDNASVDDALARGTYKVMQATGRLIERTLVRNLA